MKLSKKQIKQYINQELYKGKLYRRLSRSLDKYMTQELLRMWGQLLRKKGDLNDVPKDQASKAL